MVDAHVTNRTVSLSPTPAELPARTILRGRRGPQGPVGPVGPTGPAGTHDGTPGVTEAEFEGHINSETPHPAYDDIPDLATFVRNRLV